MIDSCHSASMISSGYNGDGMGDVAWIVSAQEDQNALCGDFKEIVCDRGWLAGEADNNSGYLEGGGDGYVTFFELALWGQTETSLHRNEFIGDDGLKTSSSVISFYNSLVLNNIVAGKVPGNGVEDKIWVWGSKFPGMAAVYSGDTENVPAAPAANGCRTVGECYALGINPEDPDDDFKIVDIKMEDGRAVITLNHTEDGSGNSFEDRIRTLGKKTLIDAKWVDITDKDQSEYRFFKVTVEMP